MKAFITAISAFLPGEPVGNNDLDRYLGEVTKVSAKTRRIILSNNGIKTRYYAIDPGTGKATHTNAQLAAQAVRNLQVGKKSDLSIDCLCCGTASPDQLMPGHASMVHGELASPSCEVMSTAGVCLSGITALKYGAMSVALGMNQNVVATGSELASTFLREDFFQKMTGSSKRQGEKKHHPAFSFESEFLRWMLSDGAGAVLVEKEPRQDGLNLQVNWIEITSHAQNLEACMYAGARKEEDGTLVGWRDCIGAGNEKSQGVFTIKQDARLLNQEIIHVIAAESLPLVLVKHGLKPENVDWFLPHYSSEYFRSPLMAGLKQNDFHIPEERWFTNLAIKGNSGAASFYIMLEELYSSGRLKKGDQILGMIPESGRFSVGWTLMTVV